MRNKNPGVIAKFKLERSDRFWTLSWMTGLTLAAVELRKKILEAYMHRDIYGGA